MTLSAYVQDCSGESLDTIEASFSEGAVATAPKLIPAWVEIIEEKTGVSLAQYCSDENHIATIWYESIAEAKSQAEREFGIHEEHWFEESY